MVVAFSACALVQVRKKKEKKRESFSLYYAADLYQLTICVYISRRRLLPSSSSSSVFFLPSFLPFCLFLLSIHALFLKRVRLGVVMLTFSA